MRGKTIQIYLPDGNPRSAKICNIRDSIISALQIPRSKFNDFSNREELGRPGIYFLISQDEISNMPDIYIGESESLLERLKNHKTNREWNHVICFSSDSEKNPLNKAHVKYLESIAIELASKVNKCNLQQGKVSLKSNLSDSDRDFVLDVFDDIKILISALGYPIFDEIKQEKKNTFICSRKGVTAKGEYSEDEFVVYENSQATKNNAKSVSNGVIKLKEKLIDEGILVDKGDFYIFTKNYSFKSPSGASDIVLGNSTNGWIEWKNSDGKTLSDIYRK